MSHHQYLIIGGGMASDKAVRGIREVDPDARIAILAQEEAPPYDRPPLSKGLWTGMELEKIWRGTEELPGVQFLGSRRALRLEPEIKTVTDDRGIIYTYDRLLLATGGKPRQLEDAVPQVIYFRTIEDYKNLRSAADRGGDIGVIGGGFIGAELAAALASTGARVTLIFRGPLLLGHILPTELALRLTERYAAKGVTILSGSEVASVRRSGDRLLVATRGAAAQTLRFDSVVAGLGIEPEVDLAKTAGIETDDGIVVDWAMRTSDPHVYAAGDAASVWSPTLGGRIRIQHEDQANSSGLHAGQSMAGAEVEYDPIPSLSSELFEDGFEGVGELDPTAEIHIVWEASRERAIVYYTRLGRIRGLLFWNIRDRAREAEELLRRGERYMPEALDTLISFD